MMFEDCSIFVVANTSMGEEILRIDIDDDTQKEVTHAFENSVKNMTFEKTKIVFDGSYKPNDDEYLVIQDFKLADNIKDAVRNPIGVNGFLVNDKMDIVIKTIFVGKRTEKNNRECFEVAFQRFRKEQYLSTHGFNLFFDKNIFFREKRFGICVSDYVDCYISGNDLYFSSFYYARQIFDLSEYYRSATDSEVEIFTHNSKLSMENAELFKDNANTFIRRKIAMINDSKVLDNYSASEIRKKADKIGIDIRVKDKKIVIPKEKEKVKIILGFLDEEAYKGPFSEKTYLANSKRQLSK